MSILDDLTKAQDLIRDPHHWTQRVFARGADKWERDVMSPEATCFCSSGAVRRATDDNFDLYDSVMILLNRAVMEVDPECGGIIAFNDHHTHAEVMAVWDRARELAVQ